MLKLLSLAAVGLLIAAPADAQITFPAQGNAVPAPAPAAGTAPAKSVLICENEDDTGSRVSRKRVCHTAEEWQAIKAQTREGLEKFQQQNTPTPTSG